MSGGGPAHEGGRAHALDALASAEGVETPQQLAALRDTDNA